jgi:Zn ribbon nucleic-acid-binding protein
MGLTRGLKCKRCNAIVEKAKKKTVKGDKMEICPACEWPDTLEPWEKPKTEQIGRCSNCGHGSFTLAMHKRDLLRMCKKCLEVINPDTGQLIRQGKEEFKL